MQEFNSLIFFISFKQLDFCVSCRWVHLKITRYNKSPPPPNLQSRDFWIAPILLLDNRNHFRVTNNRLKYAISGVVPQGLILGPVYYGIFCMMASRENPQNPQRVKQSTLSKCRYISIKQELANHKTEVVLMSNRKSVEIRSIQVGKCT